MSLPWYGNDTQQQPPQYGHIHGQPTDHDVQWPPVVHDADWSEWTRHLDHTDLHTPRVPLSADLNFTASSVLDNLHRSSDQQPPPHPPPPPPPPAAENPLDSAFQRSPPHHSLDHFREPSPPLSYGAHHTINAGNAFPALNFTSTSSNSAAPTSSSSRDPIFQALAGRSLSNVTGVQQVSAGPSSSSAPDTSQQQTSQQAITSQGSSEAVIREESHGSIPPQHEDWLNQLPPINPEPDPNQANRWADTVLNRSPLPQPEGAEDGFPGIDIDLLLSEDEAEMAARRHGVGPGEGAIDLTGEGSSPVVARAPRQEPLILRRAAAEEVDEEDIGVGQAPEGSGGAQQRPRKRRKRTTQASGANNDENISANHSTHEEDSNSTPRQVEHLDLTTDEAAVEASIAEQQSQHSSSANNLLPPTTGTRLNQKTCIICMESFTNATATPCGHMFCYECLHQALLAGEKNSERGVGTCPVCRKPIHRNRGHRGNKNLLPVAFMKRSAFYTKGRGKEVDERRKAAEG